MLSFSCDPMDCSMPGFSVFHYCPAAAAKSLQSCPTLCDPIDGSPPGSPVPGILQARTLEWVAISFSNAWKEKWKWSRSVMSDFKRPHGLQPTRLLCPWDFPGHGLLPISPWVCLNSCPLSLRCYLTILSSVSPSSSCPQSFPASGSFSMSQLFSSGGQSIEASASASVLPMNIQSWFPLGLTGLVSLLSKGLSRVFSSTTVWKHWFIGYGPTLTCG